MVNDRLENRVWWSYVGDDLRELLLTSQMLFEKSSFWEEKFGDYSFLVFPAAKAYEGYLKKIFLDTGLINEEDYYGKHFRIGKALNPDLEARYKSRDYVYDRLIRFCGGSSLADQLWKTWKMCRNLLFHWFPNEKNAVTYELAKERYEDILEAMDAAFVGCKIK